MCLLASIDDETGKITKAEFATNEGVIAVFNFWKEYVQSIGKTYKINHKSAVDNHELITQLERATQDLAIHLITAHSPEAKRRVNNDFTIQFKNKWYQLTELQSTTVRARDKILVEEWLDGTIHFSLREKYLNHTALPERPKKINKQPLILTTHKLNWKPPENHPWRQYWKIEK